MKKLLENKICSFILMSIISMFAYSLMIYSYGLNVILISFIISTLILITLYNFKKDLFDRFIEWLVKFRFLICLIVFLICIIFKISGSSIGIFDEVFTEKIDGSKTSLLLGQSRSIRSDEWDVMTPYYFSQKYNSYNKISSQMSIEGQNMIIGYNSPVKDITVLAKPLVWGYMLLGNEYGLSWYWCLKIILLLLSSFEMAYILTKKNKKLSILASLLITFGPSTQWWFAPHMPDVLLWGMCLFSLGYHFFTHEKKWCRNLITLLLPFIALEYVIALFPSFQVGFGYLIIFLFIALIFRDGIKIFENKNQIFRLLIVVIAFIGLTGYFVITNKDALNVTMNTAYPGLRVDTGGNNNVKDLFTDLATPFLSYRNSSPYTNQSEDSTYIHFGMFILLLSPIIIKELKKKKDRDWIVGIAFVAVLSLDIIFMILGFPEFLAKITLFSYINRMKMIVGFIFVFFTIWGFNALEKLEFKLDKKYCLLAIISYLILYMSFIDQNLINYLPKYIYYLEILVYFLILVTIVYGKQKYGYTILISILVFSSLTINPIIKGTSSITNHPSAVKIKDIVEKDNDSYWLAYNNIIYSSYLLANGAKTINAVNYYPDFEKWDIIDKEGKYSDVYNRYAHIDATISTDDKDYVDYHNTPDLVKLNISLNTMNKLNIKYVFTSQDLSNLKNKKYFLDEIYSDTNVKIYELKEK